MPSHIVRILETNFITHDVKRFVTQKPAGYTFIPGQGTDISINKPEWINEKRPFTFTSLNEWPYLEFTIKIYDDHPGLTKQLGKTNAGQELVIHDVFGSIHYEGRGVFLAAGSGITPFLAIFRDLYNRNMIDGNKLILSNKTTDDIIHPEELAYMLGSDFINVITREGVIGFVEKRIDRRFLIDHIRDFSHPFYVCGPALFVEQICGHLIDLGASPESLIIEK